MNRRGKTSQQSHILSRKWGQTQGWVSSLAALGNHWRGLCSPKHNQKTHGAEVTAASKAPLLPAVWKGLLRLKSWLSASESRYLHTGGRKQVDPGLALPSWPRAFAWPQTFAAEAARCTGP